MTSRQSIIESADNLGLPVLSGTGSPLDTWCSLRIELDAEHVLVVVFDRRDGVREAAIENEDFTRRAIRPANVEILCNVMRAAHVKQTRTKTEEIPVTDSHTPEDGETFADGMIRLQREHDARKLNEEQFRPERLIDFGRNALTLVPPNAGLRPLDAVESQRRIDWAASEILTKAIEYAHTPIRYTAELISASQRYDSTVTGPAHAAQVLAREAIRLAINERLAEIEASAKLPEHNETGPISVDVHGPFDRPVFEVGRWDIEEGVFVHVVSLTREEADALHTALGRTLLG